MTPAYIITLQKIMSEKEALRHHNEVLKERLRKSISQLVEARRSETESVALYTWDFPSKDKIV